MPTNTKVINSFLKEETCFGTNLKSLGDKLYSYQTCIAQWHNGVLIINMTKYSVTTFQKHKNPLYRKAKECGLIIIEVYANRRGVSDLTEFLEK